MDPKTEQVLHDIDEAIEEYGQEKEGNVFPKQHLQTGTERDQGSSDHDPGSSSNDGSD